MICDECPLQKGCIEQRGLCLDYIRYMERVEEVRKRIEQLNANKKKAPGCAGSDESSIQKVGSGDLRSGNESNRDPQHVQPETGAEAEAEAEAESVPEAAEIERHGKT